MSATKDLIIYLSEKHNQDKDAEDYLKEKYLHENHFPKKDKKVSQVSLTIKPKQIYDHSNK